MKRIKSLILFLVFLAFAFGALYFKEDILFAVQRIYGNFDSSLQNFQKTELGNIINEFKKEVLTPPPLNVGGKETQAVLTKDKVIAQTNIQRYNNGLLIPLIENAELSAAAKAKAEDMFLNQYFEHVSPSGIDPGELVKSWGYQYIVTGENLILGNFESEKEMVQLWMDSPPHRENILNNRFSEIGVAVVKGKYKGQTVWIGVQEFGLPLSSCVEPDTVLKNKIESNKNILDQLASQIESKKNEIENTNPRSPKYNSLVDEYNNMVAQYNSLNNETKNLILQYNKQVNFFNQCVGSQ